MTRQDNTPAYMTVQDICHTYGRVKFYCKNGVEVKMKMNGNLKYGIVTRNGKTIYKTEEYQGMAFLATAFVIYNLEIYLKANFPNQTMGGL